MKNPHLIVTYLLPAGYGRKPRKWNVRHGLMGTIGKTDTFKTKREAMAFARSRHSLPPVKSALGASIWQDVTVSAV